MFQTKVGKRRDAFLNSAWEMKPFFEEKSQDEEGNIIVERSQAFNKVGHAVHDLHPNFESFSYSSVVKTICREIFMMK